MSISFLGFGFLAPIHRQTWLDDYVILTDALFSSDEEETSESLRLFGEAYFPEED